MSVIISLLYWITLVAVLLAALAFLSRRFFQKDSRRDQTIYVDTDDGWRLAVARYGVEKNAAGASVLLCPGLAMSCGIFERGEVSLVAYLVDRGYQVWSLDLRGRGASCRPRLFGGRRRSWSFESYVAFDLPAAIAAIQRKSQGRPLHLLGFGLGGAAILTLLGGGAPPAAGDWRSSVTSVSTLGSHLDFRHLSGVVSSRLLRLLRFVPLRGLVRLLAPLLGRFELWPFSILWSLDNVDGATLRTLVANDMDDPSRREVVQLSRWIEADSGSMADDGRDHKRLLAGLHTPALMIAGVCDRIAPVPAMRATLEQIGCEQKRGIVAGCRQGMSADYGHFDLLVGRAAARDIFPNLVAFFAACGGRETWSGAAVADPREPAEDPEEAIDPLDADEDPYEMAMGDVPTVPQERDPLLDP